MCDMGWYRYASDGENHSTECDMVWYRYTSDSENHTTKCDMGWYRYASHDENYCTECENPVYLVYYMYHISHTLRSDFYYETYIRINPYRILCCGWTAFYGRYIICDLIVRKTNAVHFSCDMGKYSTCPMNKMFTPYLLDEGCILPYCFQINTVCVSSLMLHWSGSFQLSVI